MMGRFSSIFNAVWRVEIEPNHSRDVTCIRYLTWRRPCLFKYIIYTLDFRLVQGSRLRPNGSILRPVFETVQAFFTSTRACATYKFGMY